MRSVDDPYRPYRTAAAILPWITIGISCSVLIGRVFGIPELTYFIPGFIAMKAATAIGLLCAALSVLMLNEREHDGRLHRLPRSILSLVPAVLAGLLGLGALMSYAVGVRPAAHPAWIPPAAAASLVLFAVSAVTLLSDKRSIQRWSELIALLMLWINGVVLVGYLYDAKSLYTFMPYASTSLHTALSFVLLGIALLWVKPDRGFMAEVLSLQAGGLMLRRMVPLTLGMVMIIGWLHLANGTNQWFDRTFGLTLAIALNIGGFSCILWIVARALNLADRERGESQARLHMAKEAAGIGIFDYDVTQGTIQWDGRVRELWGVGAQEPIMIGVFWKGVHSDDQALTRVALDHALDPSGDGLYHAEFRVISRIDCRVRWVATTARAIFKQRRAIRLVGTVQDITERKQAEERRALLLEVSRLVLTCDDAEAALTEAVFEKICRHLDADVCVNYRMARDGRSLHLVTAIGMEEAIREKAIRLELGQAFCGTVAQTCEPVMADSVRIATDAKGAFVQTMGVQAYACHPLFSHGGRVMGTLSVGSTRRSSFHHHDLEFLQTVCHFVALAWERQTAMEALRESEYRFRTLADDLEIRVQERTHDLQQSQERLRALASELNVAEQRERKRLATELHDHLQQLLVYGKMTVGQAKRRIADVPVAPEILTRVDGILTEALTYTRTLVAELSPPVLRDHGLAAGLKWLAEYMKKHEQTVTVTVPEGESLRLPDDQAALLFQSVRELLINSSKYAGTGEATVVMERYDGSLSIRVSDQGKGFDIRGMAADAAAGTPSGVTSSKFGLFSIQERMRALGGLFSIQSVPGQGTIGTLVLPLREHVEQGITSVEFSEESESREPRSAGTSGCSTEGHRMVDVLLVDDHTMVREGLRSVLDAYNDIHVVAEAQDGAEAVKLVEDFRPRVVIMDVNMPRMNGIDATARIKAHWPETTVIGISVNAEDDNSEAMKRAGAVAVIPKESAVDQLHDAIVQEISIFADT